MVGGVGPGLGLQAEGGAGAVDRPVLAAQPRREVIAGVELNAGAVGPHPHTQPAAVCGNRSDLPEAAAVRDPVVVVALCQTELVVLGGQPRPDGLRLPEIHRGSGHGKKRSRRDGGRVGGREAVGMDTDRVICNAACGVTVEVKIAVIRQVQNGIALADGPVVDAQGPVDQRIGHCDAQVAGEAAQTVRVNVREGDRPLRDRRRGPDDLVKACKARMQTVRRFVRIEGKRPPVQRTGSPRDPIRHWADRGPDEAVLVDVIFKPVEAQDDVGQPSRPVRDGQAAQGCAVGQDLGGAVPVGQPRQIDRYAAEAAERQEGGARLVFIHGDASLGRAVRGSQGRICTRAAGRSRSGRADARPRPGAV